MTDDDKRRQKADLLLEFEELKEHIAHLNESALKRKEKIYEVSKWLEECRYFEHNPSSRQFDELNAKIDKSSDLYRLEMNFDRVADLVKDLLDARAKLAELKKRKDALGLSRT